MPDDHVDPPAGEPAGDRDGEVASGGTAARERRRQRLTAVLHHAPVGLAVATPQGEILEANAALAQMFGRSERWLTGRTLFEVTHAEDREAAHASCRALVAGGETSRTSCRFEHARGHDLDAVVHASLVCDDRGAPDHIVFHVEDVSEQNAVQARLLHRAVTDALTGLPDRQLFLERLERAVERRNLDASTLALLFLDVDDFKAINDRQGHATGDATLRVLARRLTQCVRPADTVARFGGDEFVVLCERTNRDEAHHVAERLATVVAEPLELAAGLQHVTVSVGIALASGAAPVIPEQLVDRADRAMYEAKRSGPRPAGGRPVIAETTLHPSAHETPGPDATT